MQFLKQNSGAGAGSGATLIVGPCLDSNGTEYTGLVIADLTLSKNGTEAALAANATLTHVSNGHYSLVTIGNNADTLGRFHIRCNKAGYQIPPCDCVVLPPMIYDSFVAGTDRFDVNVTHVNDQSQTARDIGASTLLDFTQTLPSAPVANTLGESHFLSDILGGRIGTAQSGTVSTLQLDSTASSDRQSYVGDGIYLYGGTGGGIRGAGQQRTVVAYNPTTKVVTLDRPWTTTPDGTTKFITLPRSLANLGMVAGLPGAVRRNGSLFVANRHLSPPRASGLPATTVTIFVRPDGNDINSGNDPTDAFLNVQKAIDTINTGRLTDLATYDVPKIDVAGALSFTQLAIPTRCRLAGDGLVTAPGTAAAAWSGTAVLTSTVGTAILLRAAGDDVEITGIKLMSTPAAGLFSYPIGYSGNNTASRNVRVRDCWILGDSDCSYFADPAGNNGAWLFVDDILDSKFDSTQVTEENATCVIDYVNCTIRAIGPTGVAVGDTRAITAAGGTLTFSNCYIRATGHKGVGKQSYGIWVRASADVHLDRCDVSGEDWDMVATDRSMITHSATTYSGNISGPIVNADNGLDWAKVRNTDAPVDLTNTTIKSVAEGGGGSGSTGQVDNAEVVESLVFRLGRRSDGVLVCDRPCYMKVGDKYPVWIDTSAITSGWLDAVAPAESSDPAVVSASSGMNRELVVLQLEALTAGSSTVSAVVTPVMASVLTCELSVNVAA